MSTRSSGASAATPSSAETIASASTIASLARGTGVIATGSAVVVSALDSTRNT